MFRMNNLNEIIYIQEYKLLFHSLAFYAIIYRAFVKNLKRAQDKIQGLFYSWILQRECAPAARL